MFLSNLYPLLCQLVMHCHQNQSQRPSTNLWLGKYPLHHSFRKSKQFFQVSPQSCAVHISLVLWLEVSDIISGRQNDIMRGSFILMRDINRECSASSQDTLGRQRDQSSNFRSCFVGRIAKVRVHENQDQQDSFQTS